MKLMNNIVINVFIKPEEDYETVKQGFLSLFPFDLEQEKIEIEERRAEGFNERKITIIEVRLTKAKHMKQFIASLNDHLTDEQKDFLIGQKESRLDEDLKFYIRIDKEILLNEKRYFITEFGNCYHIKISIAAFPAKREIALPLIDNIFKPDKVIDD